jgi:hypothetical protein
MNVQVLKQNQIVKDRESKPHLLLIGAAHTGLEDAETKELGRTHYEIMAIIFSALALEAFTNTFCKKFSVNWSGKRNRKQRNQNRKQKCSKLLVKLKVICERLKIEADFENQEPWSFVQWLIDFRDDVAHANLQPIEFREVIAAEDCDFWRVHNPPLSEIEKRINLENARRSVKIVDEIFDIIYQKLTLKERASVFFDGHSGVVSSC